MYMHVSLVWGFKKKKYVHYDFYLFDRGCLLEKRREQTNYITKHDNKKGRTGKTFE